MKKTIMVAVICILCLMLASASADTGIVGEWTGSGTASASILTIPVTATAQFSENSTFNLNISAASLGQSWPLAGQYSYEGQALTLAVPGMDPVAVNCVINGDKMNISANMILPGFENYGVIAIAASLDRVTTPPVDPDPAITIKVTEVENAFVKVGDVYEAVKGATMPVLEAEITGTSKTQVNWKSGKAQVMSITARGVIKAKKAGTTVITATVKGQKKVNDKITVRVITVDIKQKKATIYVDGTTKKKPSSVTLKSVIKPANASETAKSITWTSADPTIATVDGSGVVTAVSAGTTTITMTNGYAQTDTCKITVK
ncbi:MAG: Ig-like domain-containing protein [Clostridia bacterium]|nr:Ig-like domain-containing protein [Clostridia bacterium]